MTPSQAVTAIRGKLPHSPMTAALYSALSDKLWPCGMRITPGVICGTTGWCKHRDWDEVSAWLDAMERRERGR
jgi:hypothetical protein